MENATIQRLNDINRRFYSTVADAFDTTRGRAWPGWLQLPFPAETGQPLRILDVGCGNGRFGAFAATRTAQVAYTGIDNSPALLDHAREALAAFPNLTARLSERDLVTEPLSGSGEALGEPFDQVVLFGVMHHIPGAAQRQALVRALAGLLAPGGVLAFACWRFYEYERFRQRVIPWDADLAAEVEPGDFLLDWRAGEHALRYCHYCDDAEIDALIAASSLKPLLRYRADGFNGAVNAYVVLS